MATFRDWNWPRCVKLETEKNTNRDWAKCVLCDHVAAITCGNSTAQRDQTIWVCAGELRRFPYYVMIHFIRCDLGVSPNQYQGKVLGPDPGIITVLGSRTKLIKFPLLPNLNQPSKDTVLRKAIVLFVGINNMIEKRSALKSISREQSLMEHKEISYLK